MTDLPDHDEATCDVAASKTNAAQALYATTAQIGLALRESQEPVEELGTVIERVSAALVALRALPLAQNADRSVVEKLIEKLQADVFAGIQRLQFYDRMVQHLSHLQDYLIGVANELELQNSHETWEVLHSKLRNRLISDEQRRLFDRFLSPDAPMKVSAQIPPNELSMPGSLEFF
jgi:hypothetical protein